MTRLTRWFPHLLIVGMLAAIIAAVATKEGTPATMRVNGKLVMEPAGPKPRILYPPPEDFKNLGSWLAQTKARQEVALKKYLLISRSYLAWRKRHQGDTIVTQPLRYRCKATNVVMPSNWCWYATAAQWTRREIGETRVQLVKERELAARTLPDTNDWVTAVNIVQRVYPGTRDWLLSCSAAEGGHGRWVWYGGRPWTGHHIGNDFLGMDTVGGPLQFRYSTFKPYWFGYYGAKGALADTRARGFIVPDLGEGYGPWVSMLGQALTGAYMRKIIGNSAYHWSASISRGCA